MGKQTRWEEWGARRGEKRVRGGEVERGKDNWEQDYSYCVQ